MRRHLQGRGSLVVLTGALALIACGGSSSKVYTCNAMAGSFPEDGYCRELAPAGGGHFSAADLALEQAGCTDLGAIWGTGPCPEAGRVGTCFYSLEGSFIGTSVDVNFREHLYPPRTDGEAFCLAWNGNWRPN